MPGVPLGTCAVTALLNLRQGAASVAAPILRKLPAGTVLTVLGVVSGDAVAGNAVWYQVGDGFVWSGACARIAPLPAAPDPAFPAPGGGLVLGVDTLEPCSQPALDNASSAQFLGAKPLLWGRYVYAPGQLDAAGRKAPHYSSAENAFLHEQQIRLLLVARQTARVGAGAAEAQHDAAQNCAAVFEAIPAPYLAAVCPAPLVFLDVENDSPLSAAYYQAWADALEAASLARSGGKVSLRPAIYSGPLNTGTWEALRTAMANGAQCFGAWIARYYYYTDPKPRPWSLAFEQKYLTPVGERIDAPILYWQYWESADDAKPAFNFDNSIAKPSYVDKLIEGSIVTPA